MRFCTLCEERVYTAYSKAELKRLTSQGSCVRVITEKQLHAVEFMSPGLYEDEFSPLESIALIDAILQLEKNIEQFKKRRGFYPAIKLTRLLGRLDRFQKQFELGFRDKETGISKELLSLSLDQKAETEDKFKAIKKLINNRAHLEQKLQEANEYVAFKSDRSE